jgi:hypothetical protein
MIACAPVPVIRLLKPLGIVAFRVFLHKDCFNLTVGFWPGQLSDLALSRLFTAWALVADWHWCASLLADIILTPIEGFPI